MDENTRKTLGVNENKPNDWFETLYSTSNEKGEGVPWANMNPHPVFLKWLENNSITSKGKTALVVGCGLGDDAIKLEKIGFQVTAFDVSNNAIELCKKRFPESSVNFVQADLLKGIPSWFQKFDFVLEIFTIQALPPKYENTLIENISNFVALSGQVMIITEVQKAPRVFEVGPPWLLNNNYFESFKNHELTKVFHSKDFKAEIGDECHLTIFKRK